MIDRAYESSHPVAGSNFSRWVDTTYKPLQSYNWSPRPCTATTYIVRYIYIVTNKEDTLSILERKFPAL